MKLLSSFTSTVSGLRVSFCRAALFVPIIVGLLMVPTLSFPQNSHKPTAKHFKPVVDDTAPPQAEPETILIDEAAGIQPTSEPAISIAAPVGPAWTALGPAPIPNGQTIPADVNGISLTQSPVSGRVTS